MFYLKVKYQELELKLENKNNQQKSQELKPIIFLKLKPHYKQKEINFYNNNKKYQLNL